MSSNSLT